MLNSLDNLLEELRKEEISFCISGEAENVMKRPKIELPDGRNELRYMKVIDYPRNLLENFYIFVEKSSLRKFVEIVTEKGFSFYGVEDKVFSYYIYDVNLGLVNLVVEIVDALPKSEKIGEYSFTDEKIDRESVQNFFLFKGRLICFVAPEGGGKTSTTSAANTVLQNYPVKIEFGTSSSFKKSKIYRIYDLSKKILWIYKNKFLGRITLLDRYIYLTFRENRILRKILFFLAPEPDMVFVMEAPYSVLKERRGFLCKPEEEVKAIYDSFNDARNKTIINSQKPIQENLGKSINLILGLYSDRSKEKNQVNLILGEKK